MKTLRVASFTVHATAVQSRLWKIAAESEGFASVGAWAARALDAYLRQRARAGGPVPLAWHRGRFTVILDGEAHAVRGHVSPPFGSYRGDGTGRRTMRTGHLHRLVYLPTGRLLATVGRLRDSKALAAELARLWVRGDGEEPATDARAAVDSLTRHGQP